MIRRRPFQILTACGMLALATGCSNSVEAGHLHPKISHDVRLEPGHSEIAISLELGAALRLILPAPAAGTDDVWEIVSNNTRVLEQTTGLHAAPANGPASARTTTVAFYALLPGKSIVRFALVRQGEGDAVPAGHFEVVVVVREPDSE
jgi:hypothetical protein